MRRPFVLLVVAAALLGLPAPAVADVHGPPYAYAAGLADATTGVVASYGLGGNGSHLGQGGLVGVREDVVDGIYRISADFSASGPAVNPSLALCIRAVGVAEHCGSPLPVGGIGVIGISSVTMGAGTRSVEVELRTLDPLERYTAALMVVRVERISIVQTG